MATVNFSVPEEVRRAFNRAFRGENRSAVIARLMRQAVEERDRERRRAAAVAALLRLRARQRPAHARDVRAARTAGRP